jgi:hypothetical protein
MKSKTKKAMTIFQFRCSLEFSKLCRHHSIKQYQETLPAQSRENGSTAHFIKEAAREKLLKIGVSKDFLKSIV